MSYNDIALVTGGTGDIGIELVKLIVTNNPQTLVLLGSRSAISGNTAIKQLEQQLSKQEHKNVRPIIIDVESEASIAEAIKYLKNDILANNPSVSGIGYVYHNAGLYNPNNTFQTTKQEFQVNYYSITTLNKLLIQENLLKEGAKIILSGSLAGCWALFNMTNKQWKNELLDCKNSNEEKLNEIAQYYIGAVKDVDDTTDKSTKLDILNSLYPNGMFYAYSYGLSKALSQIYLAQLATVNPHVITVSVSPGAVRTKMTHNQGLRSSKEGAETIYSTAIKATKQVSGAIFDENGKAELSLPHPTETPTTIIKQ